MKHVYILVVFAFLSASGHAEGVPSDSARSRAWFMPHYIPVQFAGNIGFISVGAGYISHNNNYELNILYGYVPASVAKTVIHAVTAKNIFPLTRFAIKNNRTLVPYAGLGLTVEIGGNAFFSMPDRFPDSYYDFPKNLHVLAYGGVKLQHHFRDEVPLLRGVELYAEAGTIDVYLWYKSMSSDIRLNEIFSLALGINLLLNR